MAVRQYIGSRYVPILMGEWDKTLSYEALNIVTYKGNSFTSKKPVPQGTEISNNEYWVNTGNYNAQVNEFINKVNSLTTEVNEINQSLDSINSNLTNIIEDDNTIYHARVVFSYIDESGYYISSMIPSTHYGKNITLVSVECYGTEIISTVEVDTTVMNKLGFSIKTINGDVKGRVAHVQYKLT